MDIGYLNAETQYSIQSIGAETYYEDRTLKHCRALSRKSLAYPRPWKKGVLLLLEGFAAETQYSIYLYEYISYEHPIQGAVYDSLTKKINTSINFFKQHRYTIK